MREELSKTNIFFSLGVFVSSLYFYNSLWKNKSERSALYSALKVERLICSIGHTQTLRHSISLVNLGEISKWIRSFIRKLYQFALTQSPIKPNVKVPGVSVRFGSNCERSPVPQSKYLLPFPGYLVLLLKKNDAYLSLLPRNGHIP